MTLSCYGLMEFPQKLETLIERSGKSQSMLAGEVGVNQSAISAMTRGERRPYMDQAFRLARALGVSLDYLADDDVDDAPAPELTDEDRWVLQTVRVLGHREAMRRLALAAESPGRDGMPDRPIQEPVRRLPKPTEGKPRKKGIG